MTSSNLFQIIIFTIKDVSRSKWIFMYGLLQLIIIQMLFYFSSDPDKTIVSLLNLSLILNPVVSLIFSTIYLYNSREFIELLLSHPIKRSNIFFGLYFGLTITLNLIFSLGLGLPFIFNTPENISVLLLLLLSGILLTFIYTAISIYLVHKIDDKAAGLGVAIIIWFFFAVVYDGILLIATYIFSDYPLEMPMIIASVFNPIDLGRISVMLKLNLAALMGYTGAVFEKFFGSNTGIFVTITGLCLWIAIPLTLGLRIFKKKDF